MRPILDTVSQMSGHATHRSVALNAIPTPSPPSSPARPPSINNKVYNLSKRPRSPVAADLDTANILPLECRRKRIKPARVRD